MYTDVCLNPCGVLSVRASMCRESEVCQRGKHMRKPGPETLCVRNTVCVFVEAFDVNKPIEAVIMCAPLRRRKTYVCQVWTLSDTGLYRLSDLSICVSRVNNLIGIRSGCFVNIRCMASMCAKVDTTGVPRVCSCAYAMCC